MEKEKDRRSGKGRGGGGEGNHCWVVLGLWYCLFSSLMLEQHCGQLSTITYRRI